MRNAKVKDHFKMMSSLGDFLSLFFFYFSIFYVLEWDVSQERNKTGTNQFHQMNQADRRGLF